MGLAQNRRAGWWRPAAVLAGIACLFLMLSLSAARAVPQVLVLEDGRPSHNAGPVLEFLSDPGETLTVADLARPEVAARFKADGAAVPALGFSRGGYWARLTLRDPRQVRRDLVLVFHDVGVDHVRLYEPAGDGLGFTVRGDGLGGATDPAMEQRRYIFFPISPAANAETTYYLRVDTAGSARFPVTIDDAAARERTDRREILLFGVLLGTMVAIAGYLVFIWGAMRERSLLLLAAHTLGLAGYLIGVSGMRRELFAATSGDAIAIGVHAMLAIAMVFGVWFAIEVLGARRRFPRFYRIGLVLIGLSVAHFAVALFDRLGGRWAASNLVALLVVYVVALGLHAWRRGVPASATFTLAWGILLATSGPRALVELGLLPYHSSLVILGQVGPGFTAIFLAFTLSRLIRQRQAEAEGELAESLTRYDLAVRSTSDGIFDVDLRRGTIFCSDQLSALTGLESGPIRAVSATWFALTHPDDVAANRRALSRLIRGQSEICEIEYRYRRPDGSGVGWLSGRALAVRGRTRRAVRLVGSATDITARKAAEEASRESDAFVRAIVDTAVDAIVTIDEENRIIEYNPAACRIFGHARDIALGQRLDRLLVPEIYRAAHLSGIAHYLLTGESRLLGQSFEVEALHADGRLIPIEMRLSDTRIGGRRVFTAFMRDITELKRARAQLIEAKETLERRVEERTGELTREVAERQQAEAALRASETLYKGIFANSMAGILVMQPSGTVTHYNEAIWRMMGRDADPGLAGLRAQDLIHPDDRERMTRYFSLLARGLGERVAEECRFPRRDGVVGWAQITASPLRDGDGRVAGVVAVALDVTERKGNEEALLTARDAAQAAMRAKSEFLAVMSHEIRTPMNGVLGMARLLMRSDLDEAQRDQVRTILDSGTALLGILNRILDFSKLEAGRAEVDLVEFAVRPLVADCMALLAPRAAEKELRFDFSLADSVPPYCLGDANRIRQVLLNLVGNALKFTAAGGVTVSVYGAPIRDGQTLVRFSVRDTGIGIADEAKTRLFSEFAQADSSIARRYGGTGLGLAISRRIAELLGGTIGVESREGAGSTFWFDVPLTPLAELSPAKQASGGTALPPLRLLLVEDNPTNQKVAAMLLRQDGHAVDVASDGAAALELVDAGDYDVVLMDVQMPGMDGLEATRRIRARTDGRAAVPVIAMTANTFPEDIEQCREAGMDAHVGKPFDPDQLSGIIHDILAAQGRDMIALMARAVVAPLPVPAMPEIGGLLLDPETLGKLESRLGLADVHDMVAEFLDGQEAALAALGEGDDVPLDALRRIAHTVKGTAGSFGLSRIAATATALDLAGKAGDRAKAMTLRQRLVQALSDTRQGMVDRYGQTVAAAQ
ncbi:MAG: PAS domain S-box protein [Alphaproteobacteria bacterium]|jgi:PAS domain S-box-containing protein|nr:PAS domain S-box protein [Alphaproteobacteria bacterium]